MNQLFGGKAATTLSRIMEQKPFQKRVSMKNHKSKGNFLMTAILMCLCFLTVSVKAQSVYSVTTDKNSYPKGETVIATASVSSPVHYTVFYLKNNTVPGSTALQRSGNIYKYNINTTTPKATFGTSTLNAGTYYVYAVAYNSSNAIIDNTHYATITITNAENHVSSTPSTSTAMVNFTKVSGKYIFINGPEDLTKRYLGDHASGYGNKIIYRGNISGKTRVYAEFNNATGENIYYGYCFWNGSNQSVTIDILSHGVSYGWNNRNVDTWQGWFSNSSFRLGGSSYSIAPNSAAWLFVGNSDFVYNSSAPNQFTSSALSITPGNTFDCALEISPSYTIQIEAVAFHNFANIDGTFTPITTQINTDVTGVSDYNAVTGNLSWTIGNDVVNGDLLPVQGTQALGNGIWRSHYTYNPEALPIKLVNGSNVPLPANYGVIYTETLTFTNNSNSDKILEYYIRVPQTYHQNGNSMHRAVGVNLPNDQQFLAYEFSGAIGADGVHTDGWDSYGGDYQNFQPDQPVDRFVKKIIVPRNSTTSTVVEYVLGGQSVENVQHFVKVAASSNYKYDITTSSSPSAGGTTSGGGTYAYGASRTVTASANSGYTFSNWTDNGSVVSTSATYTFTVTSDKTLVANFKQSTTPPANDQCANATSLPCGTTVSGTLVGATPSTIYDNYNTLGDVFYQFTAANSGNHTITFTKSNSSDDIDVKVYQGCSSTTELASIGANGITETTTFNCTAGTNYRIRVVSSNNNGSGGFSIKVDCPAAASLTVSPSSYNFPANGGTSSAITVTSNVSWTVSDDASWLTTSKTSGSNNSTFTMTATENTSTSVRSATVTVSGGGLTNTITVTQDPNVPAAFLNVSPTSYNFDSGGGASSAIMVNSNVSWTISDNASWLTTSKTSGSNNSTFTMTATANTSTSSRNAKVSVTGGGMTGEISVTQAGVSTYAVNVSSNPPAGGSVSGGGTYTSGASCSVKATANSSYTFTNWTDNGSVVSTSATYTFTVMSDKTLVANFKQSTTPPANDQCANATSLPCGTTVSGTLVGATPSTIYN